MSLDQHLQPPEPRSEHEEQMWCDRCEADTWHMVTVWPPAVAVCQDCREEIEVDDEEMV